MNAITATGESTRPQHRRLPAALSHARQSARFQRAARLSVFAGTLILLLTGILSYQFLYGRVTLEVGQVCRQDIRVPKSITYESEIKTAGARAQAAAAVSAVYTYDPLVASRQANRARQVCAILSDLRRIGYLSLDQKAAVVRAQENLVLSTSVISDILTVTDITWYPVVTETLRLTEAIMQQRIRPYQVAEFKTRVPEFINKSAGFTTLQTRIITELTPNFIVANEEFDAVATANARRLAQEAVKPVYNTLEEGEIIIRDGEIVSALVIEELHALGLLQTGVNWPQVGAAGLLTTILVVILLLYTVSFHGYLWAGNRQPILLGLILVGNIAAAELALPQYILWPYILYVFPFAAAPMLVAVLIDAPLGLFVSIFSGAMVGFIADRSLELTIMCALGGGVAALLVQQARRLNSFVWAGLGAAGASFAVILVFRIPSHDYALSTILALALASLVGGILAAVLAMGSFYILGSLFDVTTTLRLLELANPDQPLLKRLLLEAPGTYNHSLLVSNLAERAAEQIGADALLARVGGYYHDIGKVLRPYFFVENQMDGQNIHDRLDPATSGQIIISHVTEGLILARKHRLAQRIQDFIAQHHGDGLVTYFYCQARNQSKDGVVDTTPFRYPGPKPQTREIAIVMLADGAESIVRASREHSPEEIDRLVNDIINRRLAEGELDECDLTLRDLTRIRHAFVDVLQGMFHPRIEYPRFILPSESTPILPDRPLPIESESVDETGQPTG